MVLDCRTTFALPRVRRDLGNHAPWFRRVRSDELSAEHGVRPFPVIRVVAPPGLVDVRDRGIARWVSETPHLPSPPLGTGRVSTWPHDPIRSGARGVPIRRRSPRAVGRRPLAETNGGDARGMDARPGADRCDYGHGGDPHRFS